MWTGPISVAILVTQLELDAAMIYVNYIRYCYPEIKNQVAFHFLSPIEKSDQINTQLMNELKNETLKLFSGIASCQQTKEMLKNKFFLKRLLVTRASVSVYDYKINNVEHNIRFQIFILYFSFNSPKFEKYRKKFHQPHQHLRNLARKESLTKYVLLTDIDILPSYGLAKDLSNFLKNQHCHKCAYVITPYELDSNFNYPRTKNELKQLALKKHARLYHSKVYPPNQHATNVSM